MVRCWESLGDQNHSLPPTNDASAAGPFLSVAPPLPGVSGLWRGEGFSVFGRQVRRLGDWEAEWTWSFGSRWKMMEVDSV